MNNFAVIRLGKDSVADIHTLDALHQSPTQPVTFTVRCSQVPQELSAGDYAFFCLGSDNNKGIPTTWARGVRALGTVASKTGGPGYNDQWDIAVEIKVVLPQSVGQKELLARTPKGYFWCSDIPVLGVDTHSNQTVQMIKRNEPNQEVAALAYALTSIFSIFRADTIKAYPELSTLFDYEPPAPTEVSDSGWDVKWLARQGELDALVRRFQADAGQARLRVNTGDAHRLFACLLSKRFLIATGLAGSGKTKLAQALTRWITPPTVSPDPFTPGAKIESERATYYVNASDELAVEFWNSEMEEEATKATLPREMIKEWATYIEACAIPRETPARDIREAVKGKSKFSDQLHSFETHLKAAAFALANARIKILAEKCYEVVPVGADWTGNENVLGYPDGLHSPKLRTDGSVEESGAYVTKPALDLILHATDHPGIPHFLILDEMNLSHVERYFADILSAIESEEKIQLHNDGERKANGKPVPSAVALPKNLFIIGTVNVDETTYMFSPKVLDRANVIEFRMDEDEVESFLGNPAKPDLLKLDGKGAVFGNAFVAAAKGPSVVPADVKAEYEAEMLLFFNALRGHGAEFGYRVAHEAARFVYFYKLLGNYHDGDAAWFSNAFDCVVFQKFLPKLHGSRTKLGPLLKKLWFLCVRNAANRSSDPLKSAEEAARSTEKLVEPSPEIPDGAPYPLSAEKIGRMWRLLNENGFASFAEA